MIRFWPEPESAPRTMTQPGFDAACDAAVGYQLECYASGEPQAAQERFLKKSKKAQAKQ